MQKRLVLKSILHGYVVLVDFSDEEREDDNYERHHENLHDALAFLRSEEV